MLNISSILKSRISIWVQFYPVRKSNVSLLFSFLVCGYNCVLKSWIGDFILDFGKMSLKYYNTINDSSSFLLRQCTTLLITGGIFCLFVYSDLQRYSFKNIHLLTEFLSLFFQFSHIAIWGSIVLWIVFFGIYSSLWPVIPMAPDMSGEVIFLLINIKFWKYVLQFFFQAGDDLKLSNLFSNLGILLDMVVFDMLALKKKFQKSI